MIEIDANVAGCTMRLMDFGGELSPFLGGPVQRIERLGSRFAMDIQLPPMRIEPDGRRMISQLARAKFEGVRVEIPQVDFDTGAPGSTLVDGAVPGGTSLPIKSGTAYYAIKEGQFVTVIHSGRRYVHMAAAQLILDASGEGDLTVHPMLRTPLSNNDVIEIGRPMIEGWISGNEYAWTLDMARTVGLSFTVAEIE
jgi:hypothetical protein